MAGDEDPCILKSFCLPDWSEAGNPYQGKCKKGQSEKGNLFSFLHLTVSPIQVILPKKYMGNETGVAGSLFPVRAIFTSGRYLIA